MTKESSTDNFNLAKQNLAHSQSLLDSFRQPPQQLISPNLPQPEPEKKNVFQQIGDFLRPTQTTEQLQQERQQTLMPEAVMGIKQQQATDVGAIPIPGSPESYYANQESYIDPFGAVGALKKVGKNLTLKTLERLKSEVKVPSVGRDTIEQFLSRGDVKQAEKDAIRGVMGNKKNVNVQDLISTVEDRLLPLKALKTSENYGLKYEGVSLPDELRGAVANYEEHVYQSPIKTSAGGIHFAEKQNPNYFAHTRVEDLPPKRIVDSFEYNPDEGFVHEGEPGSTRRVIEIQSDLFQKGRLDLELASNRPGGTLGELNFLPLAERKEMAQLQRDVPLSGEKLARYEELLAKNDRLRNPEKATELAQLEPYRNIWWERVVREEVKQAAKDGKTKLQFPTGETAVKIEGLADQTGYWRYFGENANRELKSEDLKVGLEIGDSRNTSDWIITDVLGDGRFKAIPRDAIDGMEAELADLAGSSPDDAINLLSKGDTEVKDVLNSALEVEQFDISGKIDTENPIYRFYEKDVGRYLKNKYGAEIITDPQGVKWWEVDVPKEAGRAPIEAFGAGALLTEQEE